MLPPNCTSLLQPLDQGIIRLTKAHYQKRMLERILLNIKNEVQRPTEINVRQAIEMITGAWRNVTSEVIKNCWRKAGFSQEVSMNEAEVSHEDDALILDVWDGYMDAFGIPEGLTLIDFITTDDEVTVRSQLNSDAAICEEIQLDNHVDTMEDAEEDSSDDENKAPVTKITAGNAVEMLEKVQTSLSSCSDVSEEHFAMLDGLKSYCSRSALNKLSQKKVTEFFSPR
ncbi:tigger transposable element-derived protein 6-like [Ornithodoros turicata]|uniref:tigger transposable element-derived protein 6-like n=1 Tax=Ornithodoros turicata TaxID=34597 RepID=UPI003138E019